MGGRPTKHGIEYFGKDVDIYSDPKVKGVSMRFQFAGRGVMDTLLCEIYRNGYYMVFDDEVARELAFSVGDTSRYKLVSEVVKELLKRGFFDGKIFDRFGLLTSAGVQKRYLRAVAERKEVIIVADYWLIDMPQGNARQKIIIKRADHTVVRTKNGDKPPDNAQSKEKENESRVQLQQAGPEEGKISVEDGIADPGGGHNVKDGDEARVRRYYAENINAIQASSSLNSVAGKLGAWLQVFPAEVIERAIDEAAEAGAKHYKYVASVLGNWQDKALWTPEAVEAHLAGWKKQGRVTPGGEENGGYAKPKVNRFVNFKQREWDYEAIERMARMEISEKG